ncbi:MAG: helix-turn-helix domain-containing protein [Bacteroidota bacterium]
MNYQQIFPPEALRAYVRYFWIADNSSAGGLPKTFGPIADGCPGMLVQASESSQFYDHQHQPAPHLFLFGQTIHPIRLQASSTFRTIGVYFYPTAIKSIFGWDAHELTNTCVDSEVELTTRNFYLSERIDSAKSTTEQIAIISAYLLFLLNQRNNPLDTVTQYAVSYLQQSWETYSLKNLQNDMHLSERSLERKFKQWVGIAPKLYARICRFQAALQQLRSGSYEKLSDIAFDQGYADQSHFIRSFREFTGFSPHQYKKHSNEVIRSFPELIG